LDDANLERLHVGIIAGDPDSQAAFEAEVRPYALGIAVRRGTSLSDAEEIWNDAFRLGLERAPTIAPLGRRLRAFVLTVAHAAAVDRVRLLKRRNEVELEGLESDTAHRGPTGLHATSPLPEPVVRALRRCLETANELHRAVITMTANRLTAREIADVLGLSEANAAKIVQRARAWFARCLDGVMP
jgi:DNA-directed RNA polymerase specialized sigma24 family protein